MKKEWMNENVWKKMPGWTNDKLCKNDQQNEWKSMKERIKVRMTEVKKKERLNERMKDWKYCQWIKEQKKNW